MTVAEWSLTDESDGYDSQVNGQNNSQNNSLERTQEIDLTNVDPVRLLEALDAPRLERRIQVLQRELDALKTLRKAALAKHGVRTRKPREKRAAAAPPKHTGPIPGAAGFTRQQVAMKIMHFFRSHGPSTSAAVAEETGIPHEGVVNYFAQVPHYVETDGQWYLAVPDGVVR